MKQKTKTMLAILLAALTIVTMLPTTAFAATNKKIPAKVSVTKVTATTNSATVTWKKTANATSYRVYYKQSGTKNWITIANPTGTSYTLKSSKKYPLVNGKKYVFTVRAYNKSSKKWGKYNTKGVSVTVPKAKGNIKITGLPPFIQLEEGESYQLNAKVTGTSNKEIVYVNETPNALRLDKNNKITATGKSSGGVITAYAVSNPKVTVQMEVQIPSHNYKATSFVEPTCTKAGTATYTCSDCGRTKTETIPATGHHYGKAVITTKPTSTKPGVKTYTCLNCGATKTQYFEED